MKRSRPNTLEPISPSILLIVALHLVAAAGAWWWWQDGANAHESDESRFAWMYPGDFKTDAATSAASDSKPAAAATPKAAVKAPTPEPAKADEPPVQKATLVSAPPQQHQMEPVPNTTGTPLFAPATPVAKPAANRSITLRRAPGKPLAGSTSLGAPAPPMASPTLLDIVRLNTLRPPPPIPQPGALDPDAQAEVNMDAVDEAVNTAFLAGWTAPPIDAVPVAQREARLNISIGKDGTILKSQMSKFSGSHVLDQSILETASRVKKISTALPSNFAKDSYDLELNFLLLP
jgi:hypothetical protein